MQEMIILEYKITTLKSTHVKTERVCVKEAFLDYVHTEQ